MKTKTMGKGRARLHNIQRKNPHGGLTCILMAVYFWFCGFSCLLMSIFKQLSQFVK